MDYGEFSHVLAGLIYAVFCTCFIFSTNEFQAAGLTVESVFSKLIKDEKTDFILHHIQRMCYTLMVHTILPFGYVLLHMKMTDSGFEIFKLDFAAPWGKIYLSLYSHGSVLLPMMAYIYICYWKRGNFHCHPIREKLEAFVTQAEPSWHLIAVNISNEFRRNDTLVIRLGTTGKLVITNSWLIKVSLYDVNFALQRDASLTCVDSDVHHISPEGAQNVQYLTIQVDVNMVYEYMLKERDNEVAGTSKEERSARSTYGDKAVGKVQIKREGSLCTIKGKITPEHKLRVTPYSQICVINEQDEEILNARCEDCPASEGGCKHRIAFIMWVHRRSEEPSPTEVVSYWKKSVLSTLNAEDFHSLNDRLQHNITILPHVSFHKSRIQHFLEVFRTFITSNPTHLMEEDPELCIGCMSVAAEVKLVRHCVEEGGENPCGSCQCRPMWCMDCMGKWFALRQDQNVPHLWMSSKCTCPMCRVTFCLLDVCPVRKIGNAG
ncbi:hypothetical protein M8J75_016542 [Diaphorina citri]|nr:hypothetical protein M8J75_016542 [Diaphorina citri]